MRPTITATALMATLLYLTWVAVTYLLEGLPRTLLRPDATTLRAVYALVANLVVGLGGSGMVLTWLARHRSASQSAAGFGHASRAIASVVAGGALGSLVYWAQAPPPRPAAVLVNAFSQVFTVSAAEVVVCWSVTAAVIAGASPSREAWRARALALVPGAALFGLYHIAHSPPFNTPAMIGLLTGVGMATGAFYLVSGDVYGTVIFHNVLALFGVLQATERAGRPAHDMPLQAPLVVTAVMTLVVMLIVHGAIRRAIRPPATPSAP